MGQARACNQGFYPCSTFHRLGLGFRVFSGLGRQVEGWGVRGFGFNFRICSFGL